MKAVGSLVKASLNPSSDDIHFPGCRSLEWGFDAILADEI
jgi:hypothetical protein